MTRGQLSKIDYILVITFVPSVVRSILLHGYKGWQLKHNASALYKTHKHLFKHPGDGLAASTEFVFWYPNTEFVFLTCHRHKNMCIYIACSLFHFICSMELVDVACSVSSCPVFHFQKEKLLSPHGFER